MSWQKVETKGGKLADMLKTLELLKGEVEKAVASAKAEEATLQSALVELEGKDVPVD